MNSFEKTFNILVLIWSVIFLIITKHDVNGSSETEWLSLNQYRLVWYFSLVLALGGFGSCVMDASKRFQDKGKRNQWILYLLVFNFVSYPIYLFKYGFRHRENGL